MLDDGGSLVDDGDLGAQAAEGAAEAGTALGAQRGQVMAEGALLLIAGADGDGPKVGIALSRVAQGEREGRGQQRRRKVGGEVVGGGRGTGSRRCGRR